MSALRFTLTALVLGSWTIALPAATPASAVHGVGTTSVSRASRTGQDVAAVREDAAIDAVAITAVAGAREEGTAVDLSSAPKRGEYGAGPEDAWWQTWMSEPGLLCLFGGCLVTAALVPAWWAARRRARV